MSIFSILLFFFKQIFIYDQGLVKPTPDLANSIVFLFLRNNLSFCNVFRVLGFSMFNFFFFFHRWSRFQNAVRQKDISLRSLTDYIYRYLSISIYREIYLSLYLSVYTLTYLRRWERQQGWWTSEQPPWPGGPEAQQQPHPPETSEHLMLASKPYDNLDRDDIQLIH